MLRYVEGIVFKSPCAATFDLGDAIKIEIRQGRFAAVNRACSVADQLQRVFSLAKRSSIHSQ